MMDNRPQSAYAVEVSGTYLRQMPKFRVEAEFREIVQVEACSMAQALLFAQPYVCKKYLEALPIRARIINQ